VIIDPIKLKMKTIFSEISVKNDGNNKGLLEKNILFFRFKNKMIFFVFNDSIEEKTIFLDVII